MTAHEAAALSRVGTAGLHEGWRAYLWNEPKQLLYVTTEWTDDNSAWTASDDRSVLTDDGWEPLEDPVN